MSLPSQDGEAWVVGFHQSFPGWKECCHASGSPWSGLWRAGIQGESSLFTRESEPRGGRIYAASENVLLEIDIAATEW